MDKKIISFIVDNVDNEVSPKEQEKAINLLNLLSKQTLITEKNITLRSKDDNYNLGNYFINKDKESSSVHVDISDDFIKEIMSPKEKIIYEFLKKEKISREEMSIYFLFYNTLIRKGLKKPSDINDYLVDL